MHHSGCLVISAFQIPGHFQVFQVHRDSFSRSYETKKNIRSKLLFILFAYIKIFFMIFYFGKYYSTKNYPGTIVVELLSVNKPSSVCKKEQTFFIPNQNSNCTEKGKKKRAKKIFWKKSIISPIPPFQKSKFFPQNLEVYQRTVKLPYLTATGILNNFDFHGWLCKSDIFRVIAVTNSWICTIWFLQKQCKFENLQPP